MANRRMFSLDVVDTDRFLDMSASAQALYFHLGMRADDDGFVSSPRKIAKASNCGLDDLTLLAAKGFIIPFESGVVVVTHWKENNYIRADRYKPTRYTKEAEMLEKIGDVYQLSTTGISTDNQMVDTWDTQDRLGIVLRVEGHEHTRRSGSSFNAGKRRSALFDLGFVGFVTGDSIACGRVKIKCGNLPFSTIKV